MKEPVFVSAVLYVYNEAGSVREFLARLDRLLAERFETYEIVVVDDRSSDGSLEQIRIAAGEIRGSVTAIALARRHGVELAMLAGLERSMGDFVYELETPRPDYPLEVLGQLREITQAGADVVAAAPAVSSPRSRLFYRLINRASSLDVDLGTETARLVSRRALNAMLFMREKVRYRKVLYAFTGFPSARVTYQPLAGPRGRALNRENISLAFDVLISFSDWGLRTAYYLSVGFFLFSVFSMGYVAFNYVFRDVVEGWTTIMFLLSTGFAGIFFILGLLGEYLARILIEVRSRPAYSVVATYTYPDRRYLDQAAATREAGEGAHGP